MEIFEKVAVGPAKNLCERAEVHLRICRQRLAKPEHVEPRTAEDFYNLGVSLMNMGRLEDAIPQFERARKLAPKADYVHYALATVACASSDAEAALEHLKRAIDLRAENRYQARNDADFAPLLDDPRFTELLYPERESPSA
jgi:tetratricopeptide (TPR) repeat protein